jgi:hypothetical protein
LVVGREANHRQKMGLERIARREPKKKHQYWCFFFGEAARPNTNKK